MKAKIIFFVPILLPLMASAQSGSSQYIDRDIFNICAAIGVTAMFMLFILSILKKLIDYRIKNKIIENGFSNEQLSSVFHTNKNENKQNAIKWFLLLLGAAIGFTIIMLTLPLGIHSLAVMVFCNAGSFLGYYLYLNHQRD